MKELSIPTPKQLADAIHSGSLASELNVLAETGQHNAIAEILNRKDFVGYITGDDLQKGLLQSNALAHLDFIRTSRLMPCLPNEVPSVPAPYAFIILAIRLEESIKHNRRVPVAEVEAGADMLIAVNLMSSADKEYLLSFEQKISYAQKTWGLDIHISTDSVTVALKDE